MELGLFVALAAGGAVALLAIGLNQPFALRRTIVRNRLVSRDAGLSVGAGPVLRSHSRWPLITMLPFSEEASERLRVQLAQAGWSLRPGEYLAVRVGCTLACPVVASLSVGGVDGETSALRLPLSLAFALAGWFAPRLLRAHSRQRRLQRIEQQIPDALTAMAKSLRTGTGLLQALAYAAEQIRPPLGPELQGALRDLRLGAEAEDAFAALSQRVGSPDLDIAITAIMIQRNAGGNLSEILDHVTKTIRERAELHGELRTVTSQQRLSAYMAAMIPVGVALGVNLMRPDMGNALLTTTPGRIALAVGIGFQLLGLWLMRRLMDIEI